MADFTHQPIYSQGKSPQYSRNRRLGGPHSQYERSSEEKNLLFPPGVQPVVYSL
jgi:hypothetical protein